ncbi:DUF6551 family protein [Paenibacillus elgii]|uniref:DUF6551 family protein n=1 Tax=Paenibacillus elgii TaxID=189691 RepID=UPI00203DFD5F|nr:DUF6551 family protein [Paenibacillus elgii]MCM3273071.1 ParB N-terminal domain-containing protein [Paenibacillus elgii]
MKKYQREVELSNLKVDRQYQRDLTKANVNKIIKNFDNACIGVITVSAREDGFYYIIDGQHRVEAMRTMKFSKAPCLVMEGLTYEEEAKMYYHFNTTKKINQQDRNKARLQFQDQTILDIVRIAESCNLKITFKDKEAEGIRAHNSLEAIYNRCGAEHLENVLRVISEAFAGHKDSLQGRFIQGVSEFLIKYGDLVELSNLVNRLRKEGMNNLTVKAKELSNALGGSMASNFERAIVHFHDKGKKESARLSKI